MNSSEYATVQDAFTRMVIPLRREFGLALDVPRMRHDVDYAQFVVAAAMRSQDPHLLRCAQEVGRWLRLAQAQRARAPA